MTQQPYPSFGDAAGHALAHNARQAADIAEARAAENTAREASIIAACDAADARTAAMAPAPAETVHAIPPAGTGLTPCCGRTPFELPPTDRATAVPEDVTCTPPPGDDEAIEERQDREAAARAHTSGDHQWCDVTCETNMPTEHLRNFVVAKGYPGTSGALAELERRATAAGQVAGIRQAADLIDNDDDCGCGGCDSCTARKDAARLRARAGEVGGESTTQGAHARQDAQDAAATLRQAAQRANDEGDGAARDRLRARADEISRHGAQAGGKQAAADQQPVPALSDGERSFLAYALDLAFDMMADQLISTGFSEADDAAYKALRKLAGGEEQ